MFFLILLYNILRIESLYKLKYNNKYVCNTQLYNI